MKKERKLSSKKILALCFFGLALIFSGIFAGKVAINYNLSDYLDDSTETKIALKINDEEFGATGNLQVMVKNVDENKAEEIYYVLKDIDHVSNVNFDKYDTNYFKDNNALYVIIIDGDDYSGNAKAVVKDIKVALVSYGEVEYAGTTIEKQSLQEAITSQMVYILIVAVLLVAGVLLLTSQSWIEPILLLLSCGVAILINKGTNIFFGNISYITNSISSILQLALSIDYSIVLLHEYRERKKTISNKDEAMKESIKAVIRPISASSLTTIAGLLALLFMSFHIGFDIGIVLMKGIIISVITSLTLLPVLTLLFDGILTKTKKKAICPPGKPFASFAIKGRKFIAPLSLVLICTCGYLQTKTPYVFTDTKSENAKILNVFGQNNTVVVLYKNQDDSSKKETELIKKINDYHKENGEKVLTSYTSYNNTVEEEYDIKRISQKIEMSEYESSLLMSMYQLYKNPEETKMSFSSFVDYTYSLIRNDEDAKEIADEEIVETLKTIIKVDYILNSDFSDEEFYAAISSLDGNEITLFSIKQIYGTYFYEEENKVDLKTMLDFTILSSQSSEMSSFFDTDAVTKLESLSEGIVSFNTNMDQELSKEQFQGYMYSQYGTYLSEEELNQIYSGYYLSKGEEEKETIPFLPLMKFLISSQIVTDETAIATIGEYDLLYQAIHSSYSYKEFIPALRNIASALTGNEVEVNAIDEAIEQIYIVFFREVMKNKYGKINGETLIDYILKTSKTNPVISSQLTDDSLDKLEDMLTIGKYLDDTSCYSYKEMYKLMETLKGEIRSTSFSESLDEAKISGTYIKYLQNTSFERTSTIKACDLLNFVKANMNTNSLLSSKIDEVKKGKIDEASDDINRATALLRGENYSRMLLSLNLSNGGEETTSFVKYLEGEVKNIFGEDAHITGEIVSTYDLQSSFDHDNLFITIFTIVSIFIIVMLTFFSLSLPTLLVLIIQGAVFISMSTQILSSGVFFMSYIIVTCILMGATIDYGILLSNSYIENRATFDKKESLERAMESAMPTIFTSGLILILCGFVISIISTQSSISTVGLLIGIGGICSVSMILLALPSLLYLLDGFVLKLTMKKELTLPWKKKDHMNE